jgi:pimeloyl-ACP methyl ester carboxylesterase
MKALRDSAWVVLPDLPGHGRSGEIPGLTLDEHAAAIVPFLEAIVQKMPAGSTPAIFLAGHSMGGAIALLVALGWPKLLAGLVLVGSGAKLRVSPEIIEGLKNSPSETQGLVARWSFSKDADPGLILRTIRDLTGTPIERTLADFRACDAFDLRAQADRISIPTLLICGREDKMTPPRYSEFLHERIPGSRLHLVDGAGHAVMVEAAAEVSRVIAEFIRSSSKTPE